MIENMFGNSWLGRRRVVLRVNISLIQPSLIPGLEIEALSVQSGSSKSGSEPIVALTTGR